MVLAGRLTSERLLLAALTTFLCPETLLYADITSMRSEKGCLQVHSIDGVDLPWPGLPLFGACGGACTRCNVLIQGHADLPPLLLKSSRAQVPKPAQING